MKSIDTNFVLWYELGTNLQQRFLSQILLTIIYTLTILKNKKKMCLRFLDFKNYILKFFKELYFIFYVSFSNTYILLYL